MKTNLLHRVASASGGCVTTFSFLSKKTSDPINLFAPVRGRCYPGWRGAGAMIAIALGLMGCVDQTSGTDTQNSAEILADQNAPPPASASEEEIPPARAIIPPADLSPGVAEVVKLAQSGVGDEVVLAYINKSGPAFNPSVDEIVYLKDLGLSEAVLTSLVSHKNAEGGTAAPIPVAENKTLPQQPTPSNPTTASAPSYSVAAAPDYTEPVTAPAAPQQVNINYFENTLSPYGSWVDVADYGRCWQPTVVLVNRGWRPYSDRGRWIYSSAGWYWQSDYSWGWAAFHYGRWHSDDRIGWVWSPGSTWSPAWVSWRYNDNYCGWAPLPPAAHFDGFGFRYHNAHVGVGFDFGLRADFYTFVPIHHFADRAPHHYFVPGAQAKTIYQNSVVNNYYIRGNNNTVINEGISRDRVAKASRTPIRTVAIRDLPVTGNPIGRAERLEGNTLAVFRPNVSASAAATHSAATRSSRTSPQNSAAITARTRQNVSPESSQNLVTRTQRGNNSTPVKTETTPSSPRETTTARTVETATPRRDSSTPQSPTTFPRTWSQPSGAVRNSSTVAPSRSAPTAPITAPVQAPNSAQTRSANTPSSVAQPVPSALRNFPARPTPAQNTPSQVTENSAPHNNFVAPSSVVRSDSPARNQSVRRDVDAAAPRSLRSMGTERQQPVFNAPENFNRGSQVERRSPAVVQPAAPRSISPAPRAISPAPQAAAPAPRAAAPDAPRSQSAPAVRERTDRPDRNSRDKN